MSHKRAPFHERQELERKRKKLIPATDDDSEDEPRKLVIEEKQSKDKGTSPPSDFSKISVKNDETELVLDAEVLAALDDPEEEVPAYGEKILKDLAKRWLPLLRQGMPKNKKDSLFKETTIPENCKLLRAPTLNPEISAVISEMARARDKKLEAEQNILGLGISTVSRGLSLLLSDKQKKIQAIKFISDGCKIFNDLHFTKTQARVKLITPALDATLLHAIQGVERDENLFGNKFSEKIKASNTTDKKELKIKKPEPAVISSTVISHTQEPQPSMSTGDKTSTASKQQSA